ncbi:hypothetical protein ACQGFJ_21950 [Rhodococcus sp. 3.70]
MHDHDRSAPLHAGDVSQQRDRHSDWICACAVADGKGDGGSGPDRQLLTFEFEQLPRFEALEG